MARKKKADIEVLIAKWKRIFGLTHWHVDISIEPSDPDSPRLMAMEWVRGYCSARLHVDAESLQLTDGYFEKAIIHELLHLVFATVDDRVRNLAGEGVVFEEFRREMEKAIDGLAIRINSTYEGKEE